MSEPMDGLIRWTADRLFAASVEGGIVLTLVWIATRTFPRVPASVQAVVWWLAMLKVLLALLPISVVSVPVLPRAADVPVEQVREASRDNGTPHSVAAIGPVAHPQGFGRPPGEGTGAGTIWIRALIAIWLVGIMVQAARLVLGACTLQGLLRRSTLACPEHAALSNQLAAALGVRRPPTLRVSAEIAAPLVVGLRRPVVFLPARGFPALTAKDRTMTLCHELMHLRRHDLALGIVPTLARTLFFFHPLVRLGAREYFTLREAACDAAVLRTLDASRFEYGRLLLHFGFGGRSPGLAAGGASVSKSSLRRRLKMLEYSGHDQASRRVCWCVMAVALIAMTPFRLTARTPSVHPGTIEVRLSERGVAEPPSQLAHDREVLASVGGLGNLPAAHGALPPTQKEPGRVPRDGEQSGEHALRPTERRSVGDEWEQLRRLQKEITAQSEALRATVPEDADLHKLRDEIQAVQKRLSEARRRAAEAAAAQGEHERALLRNRVLLEKLQAAEERVKRLRMLHFELAREHQRTRQQEQSTSKELDTQPRSEAPGQVAPEAARRTYSRGAVVSLAPAADGTRLPDSTILAVPGDRIQVSSVGLFINGEPVTSLSSEFIAGLPQEPWDETIKAGHYFLAAEERTDSGVVRFWGLIPSDRIAATR